MSYSLRIASVEDAALIGQLHVAGWQGAYGGIVKQDYLDSLSAETRAQNWEKWLPNPDIKVLIAEDENGEGAGFCAFGKLLTPVPGQSNIRPQYTAEVSALYLLPHHYRKGAGKLLMQEAAKLLWADKHGGMALWVLVDNKRACAFYEALGGQRVGSKMIEVGGQNLKEACYGWRDLRRLMPKP
jgi:GNAT superfamily N-acetyltransferase